MVEKFVEGDVRGDPNVQSTIREGNFSCFFSKFLKIRSRNLQVSVAGGYGQGCKINFQIGDLDRVSIKFLRRGIWMGNIGKYSEGGRALGGITNRQNMVRIGQKIVQMLIKSEI